MGKGDPRFLEYQLRIFLPSPGPSPPYEIAMTKWFPLFDFVAPPLIPQF